MGLDQGNMEFVQVHDKKFRLFISRAKIDIVVSGIAAQIDREYPELNPLLLGILNGAFIFTSDLVRKLHIPCEISFVKYSSYQGLQSTERLNKLIGLNESISDRHVIIVEDIVDTGYTMARLLEDIRGYHPASVRIACFCFKKDAFREKFKIDYCGLEIPDLFVVGYGLDYNGYGRNFPDIYQLDK
jgi:hypoxanthine phosphoribosyltransferase